MLRGVLSRGAAALAGALPVAAVQQDAAPLRRRNSLAKAPEPAPELKRRGTTTTPAPELQRRETTTTPVPERKATAPKPQPTPDTSPRVGVFLDAASRQRLGGKWPKLDGAPALFMLDEGLEKRPEMYGSLYGERATVRIVGADSDGALRGACLCDGSDVKASGGATAVLKVGADALKVSAPTEPKAEGSSSDPWPPQTEAPLTGTICRADYWRDGACALDPVLKCPLCQFMEDSPCAAVFKVWEVCLDGVEAQSKDADQTNKEADFAVTCAEPTLALKVCVEQYPQYFGEMFGAGPPGDDGPATASDETSAAAATVDAEKPAPP